MAEDYSTSTRNGMFCQFCAHWRRDKRRGWLGECLEKDKVTREEDVCRDFKDTPGYVRFRKWYTGKDNGAT